MWSAQARHRTTDSPDLRQGYRIEEVAPIKQENELNIEDLTIKQLREIQQIAKCVAPATTNECAGEEKAVLVTTEYRGVFFGFARYTSGDTIKLRDARNCIYWSSDIGGFQGLAETGPNSSCRIGAVADIELRKITCVAACTDAATKAWVSAKTYKG